MYFEFFFLKGLGSLLSEIILGGEECVDDDVGWDLSTGE